MPAQIRRLLYQRLRVALLLGACMLLFIGLTTDVNLSPSSDTQQHVLQLEQEPTATSALNPEVVSTKNVLPDGDFKKTIMLEGLVFSNDTKILSRQPGQFSVKITTSVVRLCNKSYYVRMSLND